MGFRKVSKRFAPTRSVVGWAMEGFGKRVAVARDRDAPMGMISPFCAARLPGPTARTLASLICGHDRGKTRKCQRGMDRGRRLGPTIGGRRLGDCSVGLLRRTFDTADSGRMMPPTLFVGATIFSTRTRSRRGIRRLAILRSSVDSERSVAVAAVVPQIFFEAVGRNRVDGQFSRLSEFELKPRRAGAVSLLRDALASPLRLKHLACRLRFIYTVSTTSATTRRAYARVSCRAIPSGQRPRDEPGFGFLPSTVGPVDASRAVTRTVVIRARAVPGAMRVIHRSRTRGDLL